MLIDLRSEVESCQKVITGTGQGLKLSSWCNVNRQTRGVRKDQIPPKSQKEAFKSS